MIVKFGAEISGFMTGVKAVMGGFGMLKTGASEIGFGLKNMGTAGNIGMGSLTSGMANVGKGLLLVGGMAAIAGVAIAGYLGVRAVQAAADFQQGLNRLVTGAGDVTDNMGKMGRSILGVSVATGVMTGELLPAMYQIISSGERGAQAQDTLRVAAMGAVVEQAKVVDVSKALTTAMTDYGTSQFNATQFMNGYTRATQLGKVTLEQLSNAMGPILPIAKNTGISFADVAGAMSTMTNAGIPADRAATSLRFLMQSLEVPTKKAKDEMSAMGLNSVAVGNEMKVSLPGALEMIYKAALKAGPEGSVPFNRALSDMVGGQRSLQAMLSLTGTHFKTFSDNSKAVTAAMNLSKTAVLGWDVAQQNANVQADRAKAALAALGITVGTALLPMITKIMSQVTPLIASFTQWAVKSGALQGTITALGAVLSFLVTAIVTLATWGVRVVQFFQQSQVAGALLEATLILLAFVIGTVLVVALIAYAAAAYVAAAANIAAFWPVYLVIIIIIAIIAVVILAVRNWGAIAHWIQGVWAAVIGWLVGAWQSLVGFATSVFNAVKNAVVTAFNATIAWIVNAWHAAVAFIVSIWNTLVGFATSVFNAVKNAIVTAFNATIAWIVGAWNTLKGTAVSVWNAIKAVIMSVVNAIVTWLVNAWNTCVQAIVTAFQWLYNHNYYWKAWIDLVRNVVQAIVTWLVTAWHNCVDTIVSIWNTLSGLASAAWNAVKNTIMSIVNTVVGWLNGQWHAQAATLDSIWSTLAGMASSAWNAVSSIIMSVVNAVVGWLKGAWQAVIGWLGGAWNTLAGIASSAWNAMTSTITSAVNSAVSLVKSAWTSAAAFLTGVWNTIKQAVVSAWNFIVAQFAAAWGRISGPLTSLGSSIASFFAGLANQAISWGANLIKGIADGITGAIGWVIGAAQNVASAITGILGFHHSIFTPPATGPAHGADRWGPSLILGFSEGLSGGQDTLMAAANSLMNPLKSRMTSPLGSPGTLTASRTAQNSGSDTRPIIIEINGAQYRGFVQNLGRDLSTSVIIQKGGLR